jgi:hypothetical protein
VLLVGINVCYVPIAVMVAAIDNSGAKALRLTRLARYR